MESVFLHLVNMSITAGWLVLAVLLLRLVFHRAPKWIHCLLWILVAIRLICPVSIESMLSLIPSTETVPVENFLYETPAIHSGVPVVDSVVNPIISNAFAPQAEVSVNPMQVLSTVASGVWMLGMVMMVLYMLITTLRLWWRVRESVRLRENIWQSDRIATPFILGIIRPRIYLPTTLSETDVLSVVAHEQAHIQRRDHWWKPLGFVLLTVYWFNPLLWLGYVLLCRDIEAACDQKVIRDMDVSQRKSYSETLLACSAPRHMITACPLAFGETGVKSRIKAVLNYKKPTFWLIIVAVIASVVAAVCLLTNPKTTVSDELDEFLSLAILEENAGVHTGDAYPTEAHTVFGVEKKAGKTVVYGMVLYEEYYLYEDGALQTQSGSHCPTVITIGRMEDDSYYLHEYWIPGSGTDYAPDIRAKFPARYESNAFDTDGHYDAHHKKTLADAEEHFGLNDDPCYEPIASVFSVSHVFSGMDWLSQEKQEELYKDLPVDLDTQWLPVVPIATTEELNAFIEKYDEDFAFTQARSDGISAYHQMQEAYTDTFFAHNVLLAVYFKGPSCSLDPHIVASNYTNDGTTLQLQVDVYEPYWQDEALGQWFMMCSVPYTSLGNATKYTAVVRGYVAADTYAAAFENRVEGNRDLESARELWRDRLNDEEQQTLRQMLVGLNWSELNIKAKNSQYVAAFNIDGVTYYVDSRYDIVITQDRMAYLSGQDTSFVTTLFKPRGAVTHVTPYQTPQTTASTTTTQRQKYTLFGKMVGWSKADGYFVLDVTDADHDELVGEKVRITTENLPASGVPVNGSTVGVVYDGEIKKENGVFQVSALDLQKTDSDQFGGPDDGDANRFTGKVIQVTDGMMLMECYDKDEFREIWVHYAYYYEDLNPQVDDEYTVSYSDGVMETYPPQVTAEVITPVSSTPTQTKVSTTLSTSVSTASSYFDGSTSTSWKEVVPTAAETFITESEAIAIASEYWKVKPGDRDPDTGYIMSIHAMETPTAENPCYRMALRWLVETEGGTGNFSTLDTIYVHAETGEIALPGE